MVVSSLFDGYSVSAGAFDFDTDGFRDNNDLNHEIYNVYGQVVISPKLNMQLELGHRETEHGDLAMNFDPDDFRPNFERDFEEDSARIGLKFAPNTSSTVLLSLFHSDRDEQQKDGSINLETAPSPPFGPFPPGSFISNTNSFEGDTDEESTQFDGQYIFNSEQFNFITGISYATVDQDFHTLNSDLVEFPPIPPPPFPPGLPPIILPPVVNTNEREESPTIDDIRGYVYSNLQQSDAITWTVGVSYQDYEEDAFDHNRVNPKLGVQWDVRDNLSLRVAYFEVIKPALASNRTLEPTQVAGFNQFFDDANGTRSRRYGVAFDWQTSQSLWVGVETSERNFKAPEFDPISPTESVAVFDEREEDLHRIYAYWTPAKRWGVSARAVYDKYNSDDSLDFNHPSEVKTLSYPIQVQYFHPSGFFAGFGVTYVDQEVSRDNAVILLEESRLAEGDSDFTVADLGVGYRLPKRQGILSVSVQNLFDEDFDYQDDSYREFKDEPATGPYIPERTVMGRITLNF
jgi:hypothetical protein